MLVLLWEGIIMRPSPKNLVNMGIQRFNAVNCMFNPITRRHLYQRIERALKRLDVGVDTEFILYCRLQRIAYL